ncbi:MAG: hypothetical protein NDI61_05190 [Bdellovibrionaceae bacterium]|nr:hypothetical protein [Pseudobdellovibrionaceae bacterium]
MLKRVLVFISGFLILSAIAIGGLEYLGKTRVDPVVRDYRDVQHRHLAMFEEDQQFLSKFEIFRSVQNPKADAGPALNPLLPWSPVVHGAATTDSPSKAAFSTALAEQVLRYRGEWMRYHSQLFRKEKVDFSLFKSLSAFDHWDIERNSPLARLITEGTFVVPEKLPTPDTIDLLVLTKLRLAWGAETSAPLPALQDVRALARLLLTTENIQLFASALAILDFERLAYRHFVERTLLAEGDWEPVPRNITRRASRAIWATRGYFHIWTDPAAFERVFLSALSPVGLCEAVNEAAPKELSLRPLLGTRWPLERDFQENYQLVDRAIDRARKVCRMRYLSRMIELNRFESDFPVPGFFTFLPYSRKVFGLRIATLPFIGFEAYNSPEVK